MSLNNTDQQLKLKTGTASQITTVVNDLGVQGEPLYATDTGELYIHNGTEFVVAAGSDPLKEDVANKDTTTTLGTSDTLYPSQKAVKTYVDIQDANQVSKAGDTMTGKLTISSGGIYINGDVDLFGATGGYLNVYDIVYGNGYYSEGPIYPTGNRVYNLGTSAKYWNNSYTNRLYLNSTAYLDGSVAGIVNISGGIKVTNSSTFSSPITVNSLSTGTAIDVRTPLNAFGESIYMTIQTRARIGYDGTGLVLDDNNTNKRVRISSNSRSWDFSTAGSFVAPGDMEITDTTKGVILKSPNGTRWRITIDNTGALTSTSI